MDYQTRSVYIDGYNTKNISGCTLLNFSEPESPVFRIVKRNVVGRDGYWHEKDAGVDGVMRQMVFETTTERAYQTLLTHLYPGRYIPISIDYQHPKYFWALVKNFSVEEMGHEDPGRMDSMFVRVITFELECQPYLLDEVQTYSIANGGTIVNPGAKTEDFRVRLFGNTGVDGEQIVFQGPTDGWSMTVRVVGELLIDNTRKNMYNQYGELVNDNRKSGFYFALLPGETQITWNGTTITRMEIAVNWRYWA